MRDSGFGVLHDRSDGRKLDEEGAEGLDGWSTTVVEGLRASGVGTSDCGCMVARTRCVNATYCRGISSLGDTGNRIYNCVERYDALHK